MTAYQTLKDSTVRPDVKAGTTVYLGRVPDYGVSSSDTRAFGYECVSVTLDPKGGYPLFSMPRHDLAARELFPMSDKSFQEVIEQRDALVLRLCRALAHFPRERLVAIITSQLSLDELEKLVKFQERD